MRCFLAIELSEPARQHLQRVQAAIRPLMPKASLPRAQNLHVTLKFLGEVDDRQLARLCESMQHVKVAGELRLSAERMDAFPPRGEARIIVASMSGSEPVVAALHQAVEQRCRKLGFDTEQRKYHPHVTLARVKSGLTPAGRNTVFSAVQSHWPGPAMEVAEFVLFQSQLHPEGSRYIRLAGFPLRD